MFFFWGGDTTSPQVPHWLPEERVPQQSGRGRSEGRGARFFGVATVPGEGRQPGLGPQGAGDAGIPPVCSPPAPTWVSLLRKLRPFWLTARMQGEAMALLLQLWT